MPRTKQVRKRSNMPRRETSRPSAMTRNNSVSNLEEFNEIRSIFDQEYDSIEDLKRTLDDYFTKKEDEVQKHYKAAQEQICRNFVKQLNMYLFRNQNIHNVDNEAYADQNKAPNILPSDTKVKRPSRSRTPNDTSVFKKPKTPSVAGRRPSRSRSVSASSTSSKSCDTFRTPLMSSRKFMSTAVITPKVSDTPMSVVRHVQGNEAIVSLSGSPLMVGPQSYCDPIPMVTVPLQDGRIFSIFPEPGAPPADLPPMDEATQDYLRTLKKHLEYLAPTKP